MKERPILFSTVMVRAVLDGRKCQTRRIVKPQPEVMYEYDSNPDLLEFLHPVTSGTYSRTSFAKHCCKFGVVGDRLWVREKWRLGDCHVNAKLSDYNYPQDIFEDHVHYASDDEEIGMPQYGQYRPSIFMPRWASRILLEITAVRVERLNYITEISAELEGVQPDHDGSTLRPHQRAFKKLWSIINGPDSWEQNPWVWVISFRRLEG